MATTRRFAIAAIGFLMVCFGPHQIHAQDAVPVAGNDNVPIARKVESKDLRSKSRPQPISVRSLPEPPEAFKRLLEDGKVRFEYGPSDDTRRISAQVPMAAETSYKISFNYRTNLRWRVRRDEIVVRVRITGVKWLPSHVVWFRKQPESESFWDDRLVRHELDHVRISTDPRLEAAFRRQAETLKTITLAGSKIGNRSIESVAKEEVKERLTKMFRDVSDLAAIRYKELDRVTLHGRRPLPDDSDKTIWDYSLPR